jgi:hypothetical protein
MRRCRFRHRRCRRTCDIDFLLQRFHCWTADGRCTDATAEGTIVTNASSILVCNRVSTAASFVVLQRLGNWLW